MDPFTQRMLERARARQEKIDQKLANSGQAVSKRKPLAENILKTESSPVKSPSKIARESVTSPQRQSKEHTKTETPTKATVKRSSLKPDTASPQRARNDIIVTKKEFSTPKRHSINRRNSDVSVEINISHKNDIQIEVQVEERDVPISVVYDSQAQPGNNVVIKEITDDTSNKFEEISGDMSQTKSGGLRHNIKSRLDRLGNLYSGKPNLSSPIHRTENEFSAATPPSEFEPPKTKPLPQHDGKKKFGRLAALADQINNWEDDLTHHRHQTDNAKSKVKSALKPKEMDASTLDVSIHSIKDINKVLDSTTKAQQTVKTLDTNTYKKSSVNECQRLHQQIVAELEGEGYRRVSASQSRLVYDFNTKTADPDRQRPTRESTTPIAASAPAMATMVVAPSPGNPTVTKKPSLKKYKAPTPPQKNNTEDDCESDKDNKENTVQPEENDNDASDNCKQTKVEPVDDKPAPEKGSPLVKKFVPKINGNVDRSSVLSKAAMFETGSPKARDPAEMSLRERKALFEKNKGAAIVPKAPFGLAPSVKTLHGDNKDKKSLNQKITPTKTASPLANSRTNSKDNIPEDSISQSSLGGGIKGKLAALFSKEQTISESTIANKCKQEREKEMEMLNNRFQYKPSIPQKRGNTTDSDDEPSDHDPSEKAPLMGSTTSLSQANKKPEIISNLPKVSFEQKTNSQITLSDKENEQDGERVIGSQPIKRRSSQDSPVVLSVLEDVKRIKVHNGKREAQTNGAILQQPASLYPHLSDIETDTSHTQEEYSDCGGSSSEDTPTMVNENMNKSDNWAETSFGREVMNVVKKNNSYVRAVQESDSDNETYDSELDDMLEEAIEQQVEGPTPPKVNKWSSESSSSFVYQEQAAFKSPRKQQPATPSARLDKGSELVHSVSFYRRMQNASSASTTPMRVVRHSSPDREPPATPEGGTNVTTVRQRIAELQNEIVKQTTVISQASQALNLCAATIEFSGSTEQAEGERLLLLATHRRQACIHEQQRLQVEGAGPAATAGMVKLLLTSITVPLKRDYIRHLNADDAVGHHAVCLIKCRDRVLATSMQQTKPSTNLLVFPDEIRMLGLASDFKVTVEIYLLQASKEMFPHEVKYHIQNNKKMSSKLLTPKSKTSELKTPRVQSPAGPNAVRSPQFSLHGYCIFALQQASRKNFTLNKIPAGSLLEGSVSMDIKARVQVPAPAPHSAFLTAFDDVSGLGAWHRRWFRLQSPTLAYWKYPDDVQKKMPIGDIDLSTVVSEKVVRAPRDLCARPNTILFESAVPAGLIVPDSGSLVYVKRPDGSVIRRHLLAADTPNDRDVWLESLNKALEYVRCCSTEDD